MIRLRNHFSCQHLGPRKRDTHYRKNNEEVAIVYGNNLFCILHFYD